MVVVVVVSWSISSLSLLSPLSLSPPLSLNYHHSSVYLSTLPPSIHPSSIQCLPSAPLSSLPAPVLLQRALSLRFPNKRILMNSRPDVSSFSYVHEMGENANAYHDDFLSSIRALDAKTMRTNLSSAIWLQPSSQSTGSSSLQNNAPAALSFYLHGSLMRSIIDWPS